MSTDPDPVAEPGRAPTRTLPPTQPLTTVPPHAQALASEQAAAPEGPSGAKAVTSLTAQIAPLRLAGTRSPNLVPIADVSREATMIELADDLPIQNHSEAVAQPIPAPNPMPAAQLVTEPAPGSSAPLGSPVNMTHMRSRSPHSPHSPSSPQFTTSSPGSSRARGRPASQLVVSIGAAMSVKPRSNSSLTSTRPAPPSPATSRPQSQVLEFNPRDLPLSGCGSPISPPLIARSSPSPVGRDRAASTSSAMSQGRRMRPRSMLGTSVLSANEGTSTSDPTTPCTPPTAVLSRRGGSFDARASGFDMSAAVEEVKDEQGETGLSGSSEGPSPPPSAPASAATPGSPTRGSTLAHLAVSLVRRVVVRDFAFTQDDERFLGLGAQRPKSNWGEGEPEPEPSPVKQQHTFGMIGHWGNLLRRETDPVEPDVVDVGSLGNLTSDIGYWSDDCDDADDGDHDFGYDLDDEEPDGLYRAAFPFEPEGVNEMAVDVGDLLDVRGRGGGGDGWVVATRLDTGAEGLVPEGYLERAPEDEYPAEWEVVRDVRAKLAAACAESSETGSLSESPESTDEEERLRQKILGSGH
ncbi:hypothetical protein CspeluHIS016_0112060 [Cutaneotrichosporon spelunceum]|uniref:SH3 domain-containing protein n=1 Tax=Cutaneotrichosporon spelunceum TaxID=1672016 RepID=A0AAD3Y927_9TREE|nr:hypothetical protein CspeluHIS016_0112060 [Cutaneotrichosporon spelunceum]